METLTLTIDGKKVTVDKGTSLLEASRKAGADVPTLCYNEKLSAYGSCRLCMVEVTKGKWSKLVASCCYPAEDNLVVKTSTEKIEKIRRTIVELLMPLAASGPINELLARYGLDESRFKAEKLDCVFCGLCTRYCTEIKGDNAVYFKGRGVNRGIALLPEQAASCARCKECWDLCPGGWIVHEAEKI